MAGIQRKPAVFQPSIQPLNGTTTYNVDTSNTKSDVFSNQLKVYRAEREKVQKYKACQVRGTLTPEVKQPFVGGSSTHDRFKKPDVTERP